MSLELDKSLVGPLPQSLCHTYPSIFHRQDWLTVKGYVAWLVSQSLHYKYCLIRGNSTSYVSTIARSLRWYHACRFLGVSLAIWYSEMCFVPVKICKILSSISLWYRDYIYITYTNMFIYIYNCHYLLSPSCAKNNSNSALISFLFYILVKYLKTNTSRDKMKLKHSVCSLWSFLLMNSICGN